MSNFDRVALGGTHLELVERIGGHVFAEGWRGNL